MTDLFDVDLSGAFPDINATASPKARALRTALGCLYQVANDQVPTFYISHLRSRRAVTRPAYRHDLAPANQPGLLFAWCWRLDYSAGRAVALLARVRAAPLGWCAGNAGVWIRPAPLRWVPVRQAGNLQVRSNEKVSRFLGDVFR